MDVFYVKKRTTFTSLGEVPTADKLHIKIKTKKIDTETHRRREQITA